MVRLARRLDRWFHQQNVGVVLTHAYEMGHPDHDAVALAVHAAAILLRREGFRPPQLVEFTSYHRGVDHRIVVGSFLPGASPGEAFVLDPKRQAIKRQMFECYVSQRRTLRPFGTAVERFRVAPLYRFTAPPSDNGAYYDSFAWGMRSDRWCRLAGEALQQLGIALC
jgi:LmbE family N-acetylglucosaminyl deacetylase